MKIKKQEIFIIELDKDGNEIPGTKKKINEWVEEND
jgi:hypothetical protein